ncbi:MAG TPA: glycoside hydrolase family 3 C-terminal domain-containing protein [Nevskiaceae bacterium]|nr:glycoside hydrolase family 3 C-terminal domain-containing protein [Nevskiaceae bacterium]
MRRATSILSIFASALWAAGAAHAAPDADARAAATEAQMSDDERFHLLLTNLPLKMEPGKQPTLIPGAPITPGFVTGIPRLGIPDILETDASLGVVNPYGLREGDVATALPSTLAIASSFDPDLAYRAGAMIGSEARAKNFNVLLAPGVNLTRDPRNGRNFEYLGEDPLLAGTLAGESARGIQSNGVVATIKHFALNAQETLRHSLNARIGEAALRESDLLAFEIGIERGQPGSVMCAYNQVNGAYSCGSDFLLNQVLKRDWGYPGWVMSDWGAVHEVGYFNAGLDQHSGAQIDKQLWFDQPLKNEYAAGRVSKARLSDAVRRILRSIYAVGADWSPKKSDIDYDAHGKVAREVEASGIVLLKNEGVLPLDGSVKSVAVIGGYAIAGVMSGGGSSQVMPVGGPAAILPQEVHHIVQRFGGQLIVPSSPEAALEQNLTGVRVSYDSGYDIGNAAAAAARSNVAIVFATKWQTEGGDSSTLNLPGDQDALIAAVAKANPNTVVVLETGNPVLMPWLPQVKAVVEAWYPGQKGGNAIADVLTGAVNPSGRLPVTFPASEQQNPRPQLPGQGRPDDGSELNVDYPEGSDVGYRWFAAQQQKPLFAFGHGLSYTTFEQGELRLSAGTQVGATLRVKNTGKRDGADVAQLYLVNAAGRPLQRLAAFQRVPLKAGESKKVNLVLDPRVLADWVDGGWRIKAGTYQFALGRSAAELGTVVSVQLGEQRLKP